MSTLTTRAFHAPAYLEPDMTIEQLQQLACDFGLDAWQEKVDNLN